MSRGLGIALQEKPGVSGYAHGLERLHGNDMEDRIARLTAGQLDCLRLVDQHLSSKEIAAELGISPHTVDQRIRQAIATLGVERRTQAARLVARHTDPYEGPYQRLIHQSPYIPADTQTGQSEAAVS